MPVEFLIAANNTCNVNVLVFRKFSQFFLFVSSLGLGRENVSNYSTTAPTRWRSGLSVSFAVGRLGVQFHCRYQKTLKNGIHSFPAWRSAFTGGCEEHAGKFACCVLGQGT